jgi:hypothetical protein
VSHDDGRPGKRLVQLLLEPNNTMQVPSLNMRGSEATALDRASSAAHC